MKINNVVKSEVIPEVIPGEMKIERGQVVWANLDGEYCEQKGYRPMVIVQNNKGNEVSPTTLVVPFTSSTTKVSLPVHVHIPQGEIDNTKFNCNNIALCEQVRVIDKKRIVAVEDCFLSNEIMEEIDEALLVSFGYGQKKANKIVWVELNDGIGSERTSEQPWPALVIQNNTGNRHAPTYIVAPLGPKKKWMPTQVEIPGKVVGSEFRDTVAMLEQVRVIDKRRVTYTHNKTILSNDVKKKIERALLVSFGIQLK